LKFNQSKNRWVIFEEEEKWSSMVVVARPNEVGQWSYGGWKF